MSLVDEIRIFPRRNGQRRRGGATLACVGDEAPVPQCSHPPSHAVGESEADPPVRGQLVAYSCLSVYVHSLPPSVDPPQPLLRQKILHYRADRERKWSPALRPRYFYCAIRIVLMRQIPDGTFFPLDARCRSGS